jgi:hypothetical protein
MSRPLVLTACERAIQEARALGLGRPIENLVEESIRAGRVRSSAPFVNESHVYLADGIVAIVAKIKTSEGRRGWKPLRVERRRAAA